MRVPGPEVRLAWAAAGLYLLAFVDYLVAVVKRRRGGSLPGDVLLGFGLVVHLLAVVVRGNVAGHLPFASRFEALLFCGFAAALVTCLVNVLRRDLPVSFLGLPLVLLFTLCALVGGDTSPRPLPPILDSPFFGIHVVAAFVGYGFYMVNCGLAVGSLFARPRAAPGEPTARLGTADELLALSRQLVPFGLLFLGAGIGLGAVWALHSWGNWWGWDPKENAALVTWLAYLALAHVPRGRRWNRTVEALWLIASFLLLVAAFLGVDLLRRGLHVYQ
jgi:ABC-type transport system involved in cytochrome c biogenesis permease subunit